MLIGTVLANALRAQGLPLRLLDDKDPSQYSWEELVGIHGKAQAMVAEYLRQTYIDNLAEFENSYTPVLAPLPEESDFAYEARLSLYAEKRYFPAKTATTLAAGRAVWVCYDPFIEELDGTDQPLVMAPATLIDTILKGGKANQKAVFVPWQDGLQMENWIIKLLSASHSRGANDIELTAHPSSMKIRLHELGDWTDWLGSLPLTQKSPFLRSLCAMASPALDYESGTVHDFKVECRIRGMDSSWRVSIAPAILGDSVTLRILPQPGRVPSLVELGFCEQAIMLLAKAAEHKDGLVLVTGATGMGKSTTLYAVVTDLRDKKKKIFTVEAPVELTIPGTTQMQVRETENMDERFCVSFASGIRTSLRHKPDVLVVGEIRDAETAQAAITASRTGHLTWATLHTNNVRTSVKRMMDLGVDATNLADTLRLVMSQRLVKRLCPHCRIESDDGTATHNASGCTNCFGTGYAGKTAIYEMAYFDDDAREAIIDGNLKEHFSRLQEMGFYIPRVDSLNRLIQLGIVDRNVKDAHV